MPLSFASLKDRSLFLLYFIVLLCIGVTIFFYYQARSNLVAETLRRRGGLSAVFIIHDKGQPLMSMVYLYNHTTNRGAVFDVPTNFAVVSNDRSRYVPVASYFNVKNPAEYAQKIKGLLYLSDNPFYIAIDLDEFSFWVDFVGGIEAFMATSTRINHENQLLALPSGALLLDGAKSQEYLLANQYVSSQNRKEELRRRLAGAFIQQLARSSQQLAKPLVVEQLIARSVSNMNKEDMQEFWQSMQLLKHEGLIIQKLTGTQRTIDNQIFLFPYHEGRLIQEMMKQTQVSLSDPQEVIITTWPRRIEIQNGTSINGLAQRTAQIYENLGYNVVRTTNAESSDVEYTTVIDFSGNLDAALRVGEIIRTNRVYSFGVHLGVNDLDLVENIDIRIVLGRDFDGRYTQELAS